VEEGKGEIRGVMTSEELRVLDENSAWLGVTASFLMEAAGEAVARELSSRVRPGSQVLILCGSGNNGGDGLVAARRLSSMGYRVTVALTSRGDELTGAPREKFLMLSRLFLTKLVERADPSSVQPLLEKSDAVIVALVGTGVKGPLREPILSLVKLVNDSRAFKLAVDLPAGVDPDTGEVKGTCLQADLVVTMHAPKPALLKGGWKYVVADIGIPREAELLAGPGDVRAALHKRRSTAKKGESGKLLVIGGGKDYSGAPSLAALAAMRMGVDLVAVATPESVAGTVRSYSPAMIVHPLPGDYLSGECIQSISSLTRRYDAFVFGMGLGRERETLDAVPRLISLLRETGKPFLVDADALHALPKPTGGVLTPHAGEFEAMTGAAPTPEPEGGSPTDEAMAKRVSEVMKAASEFGSVILLKGKYDVISDGQRYKLDGTGNPGMAVGGVGDVLSGVIGAFLSWRNEPFKAAVAGSFVTGVSGDMAAAKKGYHIMATDVIEEIPNAFAQYWPGYRRSSTGKRRRAR